MTIASRRQRPRWVYRKFPPDPIFWVEQAPCLDSETAQRTGQWRTTALEFVWIANNPHGPAAQEDLAIHGLEGALVMPWP